MAGWPANGDTDWNTKMTEWVNVEHNEDGTHGSVTSDDVITKSPWIDIRAHGAVADGESDIAAAPSGTNNTTAIQTALDAANSAGGGNVLIPPGTFEHSGILTIYSKTRLYGNNYGASALRFTGDGGVGITTHTAETFVTLEQLKIFTSDKDNGDSSQGAAGFRIIGTSSEIKVLNCNIQGYSLGGVLFAGAMNNVVINGGYISNCGDNNGAAIYSPSGITSANAIRIVNITLGSNNGWGIKHADEGKGWYIAGCLIEGNVDGGVTLARVNGCAIIGNYFENTAGAGITQINLQDLATTYNTGIDIRGNWFSGHADARRITVDYVDGIVIEANHFQTTTTYQVQAVASARIKNFRFANNYDTGSTAFYHDGTDSWDMEIISSADTFKMTGLPTADPSVVGQLWSNSGILTISSG